MYRLLVTLALVFTAGSPALSGERLTSVILPAGTLIKMYVVGDVNTQSTRSGDTFQAQAASDVVVDGMVVVRKGAEGQGTIGDAKSAGRNVTNPLTLTFNWVYAADGTKIKLSPNDDKQVALGAKGVPSTVAPASLAAFGLSGMFAIVSAFSEDEVSVKTSAQGSQ